MGKPADGWLTRREEKAKVKESDDNFFECFIFIKIL